MKSKRIFNSGIINTKKKYKAGQLLTIGGKVYRIAKANAKWFRRCCLCQIKNIAMPCTFKYNYNPDVNWDVNKCIKSIPEDCYLKQVNPD